MDIQMSYSESYKEMASWLTFNGALVCDFDYYGYCSLVGPKTYAYINIRPSLGYKEKLMTLAHEAGHLFILQKNYGIKRVKKSRSEKQANLFAIQLLRKYDIGAKEYYIFYGKALKRNKTISKSWYQL